MNTLAKTVTGSAGGTESPTHGVNPGSDTLQPLTPPPVGSVGTENVKRQEVCTSRRGDRQDL